MDTVDVKALARKLEDARAAKQAAEERYHDLCREVAGKLPDKPDAEAMNPMAWSLALHEADDELPRASGPFTVKHLVGRPETLGLRRGFKAQGSWVKVRPCSEDKTF